MTVVKSIKIRLTILYVAILFLVLVAFSVLEYMSIRRELERDLDRAVRRNLRGFAAYLAEEAEEVRKGIHEELSTEIKHYLKPLQDFAMIVNPRGEVIYSSTNFEENRDRIGLISMTAHAQTEPTMLGDMEFFHEGVPYPVKLAIAGIRGPQGEEFTILYGTNAMLIQKRLARFVKYTVILVPVLLLVSFGLGYWFVKRVLKPVDDITYEARRIGIDHLDRRVPVPPAEGEIRRLAETVNGMLDRLEHAVLEIQKFTADVSHELKTPIASLRTQVELAIKSEKDPLEHRQILTSILEDIVRINHTIESMLVLSQMEAKGYILEEKPVDVKAIAREMVEIGKAMGKAGRIDVALEDTASSISVSGDASLLRRAFLNLLDNAIKYNREGGRVSVRVSSQNGYFVLSVEDTGIGISPEHLPNLFHRFYRVDKARSRESGGSGLGLAIARSIIELHRGAVRVESDPGKGSRFIVTLPASS